MRQSSWCLLVVSLSWACGGRSTGADEAAAGDAKNCSAAGNAGHDAGGAGAEGGNSAVAGNATTGGTATTTGGTATTTGGTATTTGGTATTTGGTDTTTGGTATTTGGTATTTGGTATTTGGTATTTGGTATTTGGTATTTGGTATTTGGTATTTGGTATTTGGTATTTGGTATTTGGTATTTGGSSGGAGPWNGCHCGEANCGTCPATVAVTVTGFSIDATETTNAEYAEFLASGPHISSQPSECSWNWTFEPADLWPVVGGANKPVANIDWCDAYAYCAWSGKRLCGAKGGGAAPYTSYENATKNEWFAACSKEGTQTYPYGSVYEAMTCNGDQYSRATYGGDNVSTDVGTLPNCQVTGQGIYDMSGNVYEWENSCATWDGGLDVCHTRGGSFYTTDANLLKCRTASVSYKRSFTRAYIGIRCCDDL